MGNYATLVLVFAAIPWASAPVQAQQTRSETQNETAPSSGEERELRALPQELLDAMQRGDRNALERILAPAFVFIHSTGVLDSRQEFIDKTVRAPAPRNFEHSEEIIRIYGGHTAVWTTRSVRQGQGRGAIFRGTDVLVRRGGQWQWEGSIRRRCQHGLSARPYL